MKLEPEGMTPLYLQLKNEILQLIMNHTYSPGDKIPTEPALSEQYGVSRITVRQAVQSLCDEGYLVKKQGKGTFVQTKQIVRKLENLMSFTQACLACGMVPSTEVCERSISRLSAEDKRRFHEVGEEEYLKVVRLRKADGIPIMMEVNYYPLPAYRFLMDADLSGSVYKLLKDRGIRIHANRGMSIEVISCGKTIGDRMDIHPSTPLMLITEKNYDKHEKLVHLGYEYIIAERYRYSLEDHIVEEAEYDGI